MNALRALADTCEFGTLKDNLIRDRIVCGVRENAVRRKLLQESALTLSKFVDICRAAKATSAQLKEIASCQNSHEVDLVRKGHAKKVQHTRKKEKSLKICQSTNADSVVVNTSGKEENAPYMDKSVPRAENLITSPCNVEANLEIPRRLLIGRYISLLTTMTKGIPQKKKYCLYLSIMLSTL